jgi:hypothetical protein
MYFGHESNGYYDAACFPTSTLNLGPSAWDLYYCAYHSYLGDCQSELLKIAPRSVPRDGRKQRSSRVALPAGIL